MSMKKKQTVGDIISDCPCNVLIITRNGQTLDSRTMDYKATIFSGLLDLKVKNFRVETYREYCSWDDNVGFCNKTMLSIEVE